jgi:hypothetical protein
MEASLNVTYFKNKYPAYIKIINTGQLCAG